MQRFVMPMPYKGQMVWWYPQAKPENGFQAAIVTETGRDGIAISIFQPNGRELVCKAAVHHMDDPSHRDSPTPEHSIRNGGWTFCEQAPGQYAVATPNVAVEATPVVAKPVVAETPKVPAGQKQPVVPEFDEKLDVLSMRYIKGFNARTIAARMGSGWDNDDVKNITSSFNKESALALLSQHRPELAAAGATEGAD